MQVEDRWHKSLAPLMEEVRCKWLTVRSISASTSTPRSLHRTRHGHAGNSRAQHDPGLEIRGCWGLNIVGCDLVEVSPPYDPSGNTAITAANLLFEMLCILPGVQRRNVHPLGPGVK